MLSYDPEIIDGLNKKHFSKDLIDRMDTLFKQSPEDVDYLVIATADSIRVYHQKHEYIGKHFTGNDEKNILNGAKPYIKSVHFMRSKINLGRSLVLSWSVLPFRRSVINSIN